MKDAIRVEPILVSGGIADDWVHPLIDQYASNMEKEYESKNEKRYTGNLFLIRIRNKDHESDDSYRFVVVYTFDKEMDVMDDNQAVQVLDKAAERLYSGEFEDFFSEGEIFDYWSISPDVSISDYGNGEWLWNT